jgi:hypothetical protein
MCLSARAQATAPPYPRPLAGPISPCSPPPTDAAGPSGTGRNLGLGRVANTGVVSESR